MSSAAFETARKEHKLVLLSILAPWGHWDRIMAETTFADPRVIDLVQKSFVPVRVDPLMRPDLFLRYGMGGWPTTSFLLPTAQPFYFPDASHRVVRSGGTFYAPEVLASYLGQLAEYYAANAEAAEKSAEELARGMLQRKEVGEAPLSRDMLEVATTKMMEAYAGLAPDPTIKMGRHPDVDAIELGLYYFTQRGQNREVLDVAVRQLTDMARGGIRDQLGGGFHRFAADLAWRVPAFEKTLTVNAEMLQAYIDVYKVTGNAQFLKVAEGIKTIFGSYAHCAASGIRKTCNVRFTSTEIAGATFSNQRGNGGVRMTPRPFIPSAEWFMVLNEIIVTFLLNPYRGDTPVK